MTGSKSRDVCEMTDRVMEQSVEQGLTEAKVTKLVFEESTRNVLQQ